LHDILTWHAELAAKAHSRLDRKCAAAMTDPARLLLSLPAVSDKKARAAFDGSHVSSDDGLLSPRGGRPCRARTGRSEAAETQVAFPDGRHPDSDIDNADARPVG